MDSTNHIDITTTDTDTGSTTSTSPKKHHPGSKGTDAMNSKTKLQLKEERREKIEAVRVLIGRGFSYEMQKKELARHFGVSHRQAKTYIRWFHEDFQKHKEESLQRSRAIQLVQLEYLYTQNMASGNLKEARECLAEKAKLEALNAPKLHLVKSQLEVKNDLSHLSEAQLLQITAMLTPLSLDSGGGQQQSQLGQ